MFVDNVNASIVVVVNVLNNYQEVLAGAQTERSNRIADAWLIVDFSALCSPVVLTNPSASTPNFSFSSLMYLGDALA